MRLTRDSANDTIHKATPWAAVEGFGITPHRRFSQVTLAHRRDQMGDGECFPLHVQDWASAWDCQLDADVESASAGAERDDIDGTYSQVIHTGSLAAVLASGATGTGTRSRASGNFFLQAAICSALPIQA